MATAYTNYLGSGDRIGLFLIEGTIDDGGRNRNFLVDGNQTNNQYWFNAQAVAGKTLEFKIVGSPRIIDAFRINQAAHTGTVAFKFQGYDGSTWTDLHSFNWPTASGTTAFSFTNTTAYRRYRFLGVSGNITNGYIQEIEFSTEAASGYELGDRSATITVSATGITTSGGSVQNLVDGDETKNTTHSWYPASNQNVSSSMHIDFALSAARQFNAAKIRMSSSSGGSNGIWKWQGSNDNSTWFDVSDPFDWDFNSGTSLTATTSGFSFFNSPGSYSYYRLIGVSGKTSNSPWYMELLFDDGVTPAWDATAIVIGEASHVLNKGVGSNARITSQHVEVLNQGPGSTARVASHVVHVLTTLLPAGELSGDTNAGVHNDITEFGGSDVVEPIELDVEFVDESEYEATINVSVGNPFKVVFSGDDEYVAMMTRSLQVSYQDEGEYDAEIGSLPPPPLQMFMLVSGR